LTRRAVLQQQVAARLARTQLRLAGREICWTRIRRALARDEPACGAACERSADVSKDLARCAAEIRTIAFLARVDLAVAALRGKSIGRRQADEYQ
jgi:hypothetical protein